MKWTNEQLAAIEECGNSIIVSAGAGSGKTAVLSERVYKKLESGTDINRLLILTFTNAAASEMKERIRDKIIKGKLTRQLELIDSAYITTFDSFALSVVKKYHMYLNMSKNIKITDSSIIELERRKILNSIFDNRFDKSDKDFEKLVSDFCYRDTKTLKKMILNLDTKLDIKYDKEEYLNSYIDTYFSDYFINNSINEYFNHIRLLINKIKDNINLLSNYLDTDYINKLDELFRVYYDANNYNELINISDFRLPNIPKDSSDEAREIKDNITKLKKEINNLLLWKDSDEIKREILATKNNTVTIISILKELNMEFNSYKYKNDIYTFNDISRLAIKVVEENSDIKNELSSSFDEIMIDEYQDTNDTQEYFVSLISHNNLYMVGDIKQSIYRFRNANCYIFKDKYDLYSDSDKGIKIDLLDNFRSRREVTSGINLFFNNLMDNQFGGANYKENHQMKFGNIAYEKEKSKDLYDVSIMRYLEDKDIGNAVREMFIVGRDIKEKINNKYQVLDKKTNELRNVCYSDFAILIDRSTDFDEAKKVFEYLGIPLNIYKEESLKNDNDILIIKNILKLIDLIDKNTFDNSFKYFFTSVARSFLFRKTDEEIFSYFADDSFKNSDIYDKLLELYNYYYDSSLKGLFLKLLEIFNYYEKLLDITNMKSYRMRVEYLYNLVDEFEESGNTINDFITYLDDIFGDEDIKVSFSVNTGSDNAVKLMTIHKSKGLEFPICYYPGLFRKFSFRELTDDIIYNKNYGIVIPYINHYIKPTIYKELSRMDEYKEEISEKIRLFYVALTRAREKIIMVIPNVDKIKTSRDEFKSFLDMVSYKKDELSPFIEEVEVECSKDYLFGKYNNNYDSLKTIDTVKVNEVNSLFEELTAASFSKNNKSLISYEDYNKMEYGSHVHQILEYIDFKDPDYTSIDEELIPLIKKFINSPLISNNIDSSFYKEYEFIYLEDGINKHGIIDLLIENDNEVIIIDYKLKNILDDAYTKQIDGYKKVIGTKTNKKLSSYLYSIIDSKFYEV